MNRIRLLSEQVANQIAAGEVVERPASVVKELVENSLDARAHRITVEIQAGGRSLIRVTDDGAGMSKDDALLCLERHATSKIERAEDLVHRTLGHGRRDAGPLQPPLDPQPAALADAGLPTRAGARDALVAEAAIRSQPLESRVDIFRGMLPAGETLPQLRGGQFTAGEHLEARPVGTIRQTS